LFFSCYGSFAALPALANSNERRGAAGNCPGTTIKYLGTTMKHLRRTMSGVAGNGLGTAIKSLHRTASGATGSTLSATVKFLRRTSSGLGATIK